MSIINSMSACVDHLERHGKIVRITRQINKDTELMPFYRLQLRGLPEGERKVFIFEHVTDSSGKRYEMPVIAGVYGASEEILALGMGCEHVDDMRHRWVHAMQHPIDPVFVEEGPVQEVVLTGDAIVKMGLDLLPVPVEEPGYSQMIRTGLPMITKDPETGVRNVGTYNGFFRDRDRIVAGIGFDKDAVAKHWKKARSKGERLPIAIVIGPTPNIMLTSSARIPYGLDELAIAGGLTGEAVELVKCKTIPLEVPAQAEIVIEGYLMEDTLEPKLAFGEYPGYMNVERNAAPVMEVTAITHRKGASFTPVLVGFPPQECNCLWGFCQSANLFYFLKHANMLPVVDVHMPQMGGGKAFCVIQLEENAHDEAWQVLQVAAGLHPGGKYFVAVDHDINPRDMELLIFALSTRVRPEEDILIERGRRAGLDPSFGKTGSSEGKVQSGGAPREFFRVLIDATKIGSYPPVALPKEQFMTGALNIWKELDFPELQLREPWHGYSLGYWSADDDRLAEQMLQGNYIEVGNEMKTHQTKYKG